MFGGQKHWAFVLHPTVDIYSIFFLYIYIPYIFYPSIHLGVGTIFEKNQKHFGFTKGHALGHNPAHDFKYH